MTTEIIFVENIKCGGCINSIKEAIKKLKGVSDVEIEKENDKVTIYGTAILREILVNKLATLGYPEKGNNTALAKVKSFVSCAKGNLSLN
ncbi:MAG: heavy-metal-associated domain-containing protein [Bacteroidia bacterium]|nr:heavy-metal-associated domain-containing protein [Bacteroidia bacterium]